MTPTVGTISVFFENQELKNVPGTLSVEQIQDTLKDQYPSLAKATASVDPVSGNITFTPAAGDKE
jgi:hypothetical protein